jgi:hypothetical protein
MTFNIKRAKEVCDGYFAVTDSMVEYYEKEGSEMFPDAVDYILKLRKEIRTLKKKLKDKQ